MPHEMKMRRSLSRYARHKYDLTDEAAARAERYQHSRIANAPHEADDKNQQRQSSASTILASLHVKEVKYAMRFTRLLTRPGRRINKAFVKQLLALSGIAGVIFSF